MANGNGNPVKLPGLAFGGGFMLSNTSLLVLGALGLGALYLHMEKMKTKMGASKVIAAEMDPKNIEAKIMADVMANAAQIDSVSENMDRIREAVGRQKPRIKELRDDYRDGTLSRDEYVREIRAVWQQVAEELDIPIKNPSEIPEINRGIRGGQWRKYIGISPHAYAAAVDRNLQSPGKGWAYGREGGLLPPGQRERQNRIAAGMPPATAPHVIARKRAGRVFNEHGKFLGWH